MFVVVHGNVYILLNVANSVHVVQEEVREHCLHQFCREFADFKTIHMYVVENEILGYSTVSNTRLGGNKHVGCKFSF